MSEQQSTQVEHTKVLQVLKSNHLKKSTKDPKNLLFFKVKSKKQSAQMIVSYKDLRNNFPYALIEFYEDHMKLTDDKDDPDQGHDLKDNKAKLNGSSKNIEVKLTKGSKKLSQKQKAQAQPQTQTILEQNVQQSDDTKATIFDYDKYVQDNPRPYKNFYALFSEHESIENRYLKDLRSQDVGYGRKGAREEGLEGKKKRPKMDYTEE